MNCCNNVGIIACLSIATGSILELRLLEVLKSQGSVEKEYIKQKISYVEYTTGYQFVVHLFLQRLLPHILFQGALHLCSQGIHPLLAPPPPMPALVSISRNPLLSSRI